LRSLARALVSHVEKQGTRADSGVEAAVGVAEERIPANGCVPDAGGEILKRISPFRRVEAWITSVGRWDDPESFRDQKSKPANQKQNRCEHGVSIFYNLLSFHCFDF
jgi:hypothetical protein